MALVKSTRALILATILGCTLMLGVQSLRQEGPTYDERCYYGQGKRILISGALERPWRESDFGLPPILHPPLSYYLHSLPLHGREDQIKLSSLNRARACIFGISMVALVVTAFWWGSRLYGPCAGLVAAAMVGFSPNLLAHARLITPDATLTACWFTGLALWWRYLRKGGAWRFLLAGLTLGLALLTKFSALLLLPLLPVLAPLMIREQPGRAVLASLGAVLVACLVLNAGYGFRFTPTRLNSLVPCSTLVERAQSAKGVAALPLPIPRPFLEGLDYQVSVGEQGWTGFLMGEHSREGWWYYFLVAIAVKTPLALFALLLLRIGTRHSRDDAYLLLPPLALLVYVSFTLRVQIGLRYVLPAYPFLMVYASGSAVPRPLWRRCVALGLLAWFLVASLRMHPHYLAYFNEIIGGPRNGYKYLIDSNLDWGQDDDRALAFAAASEEPVHVNPGCSPVAGLVLVSANRYQGLPGVPGIPGPLGPAAEFDPHCYDWLRSLEPIGHVGYSYLLFRVPSHPDSTGLQ